MLEDMVMKNGVPTTDADSIFNWIFASALHMLVTCLVISAIVACLIISNILSKKEKAIKELALKELKRDLKKGKEVFGWKYYTNHENILGSCVYNGEQFIPIHHFWDVRDYGASTLMKEIEQIHTHYVTRAQRFRTKMGKKLIKVSFSRERQFY